MMNASPARMKNTWPKAWVNLATATEAYRTSEVWESLRETARMNSPAMVALGVR